MTCLILIKVGQIHSTELQLNKANTLILKPPFLDLDLSIMNGIVVSKNYDYWGYFNFKIANFPFLDVDVLRTLFLWCIYLQLIRLTGVCSNSSDINNIHQTLTTKLSIS